MRAVPPPTNPVQGFPPLPPRFKNLKIKKKKKKKTHPARPIRVWFAAKKCGFFFQKEKKKQWFPHQFFFNFKNFPKLAKRPGN